MKSVVQHNLWLSKTLSMAASAALALTFVLLPVVVIATQSAQAQTLTVLHRFQGNKVDGLRPYSDLFRDRSGNLYGTTFGGYNGVTSGYGTVFHVSRRGRTTVLYTFTGGADGAYPYAGLVRDATGNLYGTTTQGGDLSCSINSSHGCGVVFKLDTTGKETVLYAFTGGADGNQPLGDLLLDKAGNLYGTTAFGGTSDAGVVFRLDPTGKETVLYSFTGGADGANPSAGLVRDKRGNFYGTTIDGGGTSGIGVVFKLNTSGKETVLHTFQGKTDGDSPQSTLIRDAAGNLYGTTSGFRGYSFGTVFKVLPGHPLITLYKFTGGADGDLASGRLALDAAGNLYGTTVIGGTGGGTVFKLDTTNVKTVLHAFSNRSDGGHPVGGLISDTTGNLYGTTGTGGQFHACPGGCGAVFTITP